MFRMMMMLFPVIGTSLMGMAVIAVLTMDMGAAGKPIGLAALAGLLAALPVSWLVARQILTRTGWGSPAD